MGVVIRRQMWLECIDVIIGWCCKELMDYSCYLSLKLFCSSIPTSVFIFPPFFYNVLPEAILVVYL